MEVLWCNGITRMFSQTRCKVQEISRKALWFTERVPSLTEKVTVVHTEVCEQGPCVTEDVPHVTEDVLLFQEQL